tara:strand:+ start:204 stop:428 length:225 start_codon:yes stop_codon:yes gene_type:complete
MNGAEDDNDDDDGDKDDGDGDDKGISWCCWSEKPRGRERAGEERNSLCAIYRISVSARVYLFILAIVFSMAQLK